MQRLEHQATLASGGHTFELRLASVTQIGDPISVSVGALEGAAREVPLAVGAYIDHRGDRFVFGLPLASWSGVLVVGTRRMALLPAAGPPIEVPLDRSLLSPLAVKVSATLGLELKGEGVLIATEAEALRVSLAGEVVWREAIEDYPKRIEPDGVYFSSLSYAADTYDTWRLDAADGSRVWLERGVRP